VDLAEQLGIAVPRNRTVTDILAPYAEGTPAA
jgi:2-dehydropantoate 2-reductase